MIKFKIVIYIYVNDFRRCPMQFFKDKPKKSSAYWEIDQSTFCE